MNATPPSFASPEEEIAHWKEKFEKTELSLEEARLELDEFQEGSRELEAELEAQLEQAERRVRDLEGARSRLEMENESLKERLEAVQNDAFVNVSSLQEEVSTLTLHRDTLQKYVRELEQTNDDLERAQRATVVSLEDFDRQLNSAIERNAMLENELDEKESLQEMVQRLKDEARDLRSELAIRSANTTAKKTDEVVAAAAAGGGGGDNDDDDDDDDVDGSEPNALPPTPYSTPIMGPSDPGTPNPSASHTEVTVPLTPSSRIAALNIVGDLLRKVGALESKLASSRHIKKVRAANSGLGSRGAKRSSRGDSNDVVQAPNGVVKITV